MPEIYCNTLEKCYPNGGRDVLVFERDIVRRPGYELRKKPDRVLPPFEGELTSVIDDETAYMIAEVDGKLMELSKEPPTAENLARSRRRAKAAVRDLVRGNPLDWFVTFTLDQTRINRYDVGEITKKLNVWLDNRVRRDGLAYVMVPELHKDGAVHFHGVINGALKALDSGTMTASGWKHPRRPRSKAQAAQWTSEGAVKVYNLPAWSLGFSTAIPLYGEREAAVGYVCKYVSKSVEKVGGRWYYHGGALALPEKRYRSTSFEDAAQIAEPFDLPGLGIKAVRYYIDPTGCMHAGGGRDRETQNAVS